MNSPTRVEFGDWQTPEELAKEVVVRIAQNLGFTPQTILEPTCGKGSFLVAAHIRFPTAQIAGYELNPEYVRIAASRLKETGKTIQRANFFAVDWEREIDAMHGPILVIGNPPWVTSAGLGVIGSENLPQKQNFKELSGLDAITGKSNFDVSEWMILRLIQALSGHEATLAMLCKSAVARRIVEFCAKRDWPISPGGVWRINAARHFDAAVDAALFVCKIGRHDNTNSSNWPIFSTIDAPSSESNFGVTNGELVADIDAYERSKEVTGHSHPEWRSGLKHDCARIMELDYHDKQWTNGNGEIVDIEPRFRFPLLKSSDVANGRTISTRAVIVPQRSLGEDTFFLRESAPKLWGYLEKHAALLQGRKSSIYKKRPPFAIFGVGEYSFAPWKVAISGLYKRLRFSVIGPHDGQPVMLDDTCYFLPFMEETNAQKAARALGSELARDYFRGRVFWDAKRPISKSILQNLDLKQLMAMVDRA